MQLEPRPVPKQLKPWQPGQSGNPLGRPKGSRNKLGEAFIQALHADFMEHGVAAVEKVRLERPQDYLKVIASLLPKELHVSDPGYDELNDEQIADLIGKVRATHAALTKAVTEAKGAAQH